MNRINKIEKYCTQKGYRIKHQCYQYKEHIGGKSFYNDGHYMIDIYNLSINGKEFELYIKTTGRAVYWLFSDGENIIVAYNQKDFLEYVTKNKDMYGNRIR